MVMMVSMRILIGVSMVATNAYAWGCVREITKLVSCEEVSLRTREIMYAPSGVGCSVGEVLR